MATARFLGVATIVGALAIGHEVGGSRSNGPGRSQVMRIAEESMSPNPSGIATDLRAADNPTSARVPPLSAEALCKAIDAIALITDETDTEELWTEGMRDINEQRPEGRKLFEGTYRASADERLPGLDPGDHSGSSPWRP